MTADAPGRVGRRATSTGTFGTAAIRRRFAAQRDFGPFDAQDLDDADIPPGLLDFGSIRVPVPPDGTVTVEPTANGRLQAVHVTLPGGRLSVSALAAPKSSGLWAELVTEIDGSLREGGARVRSFQGDWGRELHARTGAALSVFVGVDGARWMLYGVATGPERHAVDLDAALRRMLKGTVVDRGRSPFPVRTVLPLTVPDELAGADVVDDPASAVPGPPVAAPPVIAPPVSGGAAHPTVVRPPAAEVPPPSGRPPAGPPRVRAAGNGRPGPVPVRTPDPVVPRRIDEPTVIRPLVARSPAAAPVAHPVRPAVPRPPVVPQPVVPQPVVPQPVVPQPVVPPPLVPPPARDRSAPVAADPTQALPVARRDHRADPPAPLWATPVGGFDPAELGPDPTADPYPDGAPTERWPAPAPAPWSDAAGRVADTVATPLHDELDAQVGRRRADPPVDDGYGAPNHGLARAEDRGRDADADADIDATQWWPALSPEDPAPRRGRRGVPGEPGPGPDLAERPAGRRSRPPGPDPVQRAGRRRRPEVPEPGAEPSLDLAALVRDRPGRRHSRHEDPVETRPAVEDHPPRRSGRRRAEDRQGSLYDPPPVPSSDPAPSGSAPSGSAPSGSAPSGSAPSDAPQLGWSVTGWPETGWSTPAAPAPDRTPERAGRRRAPDPPDVHRADAVTDPLPTVAPATRRRRRSVDVPPDPDWAPARSRARRDGSAPAYLPEPDGGPAPRPGRHHRPR